MPLSRWLPGVLAACLIAGCSRSPEPKEEAAAAPTPVPPPAAECAVAPTTVQLSPQIPCDVSVAANSSTLDQIQHDFDVYS